MREKRGVIHFETVAGMGGGAIVKTLEGGQDEVGVEAPKRSGGAQTEAELQTATDAMHAA